MSAYTTKSPLPGNWNGQLRAYVCDICHEQFRGQRQPTDRGSYPMRNRARGAFVKHLNLKHGGC